MDKKVKWFQFLVLLTFVVFSNNKIYAQKEITAVLPTDGASNINIGILKWSAQEGMKYDLYFGLSANPELFKSDLDTMEHNNLAVVLTHIIANFDTLNATI